MDIVKYLPLFCSKDFTNHLFHLRTCSVSEKVINDAKEISKKQKKTLKNAENYGKGKRENAILQLCICECYVFIEVCLTRKLLTLWLWHNIDRERGKKLVELIAFDMTPRMFFFLSVVMFVMRFINDASTIKHIFDICHFDTY